MTDSSFHILQLTFLAFFKKEEIDTNGNFLLAVSGGVDSVVLCELCHKSGFNFTIAHCNFGLRDEESERDEAFVKQLGDKYKAAVQVKKFETSSFATEKKISVQEAARQLRYTWFNELMHDGNYAALLTAHHADDNIETLLMNFFRGTGLQGLTGIRPRNGKILRPMISFRRSQIIELAKAHRLEWVEDSSNQSSKYTRNYFRNELIPGLKKVFPQVEENMLQSINRFSQINRFYQHAVQQSLKEVCEKRGEETWIPVRKLKKYDVPILVFELIQQFDFGEKQIEEVIKLMDSENGKYIENDAYQIVRHGLWLIIAPKSEKGGLIIIDKEMEEVNYPGGKLKIKTVNADSFMLQRSEAVAQLDTRDLEFPLVLRRPKKGDYFYPLGMRKKKKISRFFIDLKLPKHKKENTWVLESAKKIIWIVGMRIDDRFKVVPSTGTILLITNENKVL